MAIITVNKKDIPPMTPPERAEEIKAIPEAEIDYSDIPELDEDWFKNAQLVDYSKKETSKSLTQIN